MLSDIVAIDDIAREPTGTEIDFVALLRKCRAAEIRATEFERLLLARGWKPEALERQVREHAAALKQEARKLI